MKPDYEITIPNLRYYYLGDYGNRGRAKRNPFPPYKCKEPFAPMTSGGDWVKMHQSVGMNGGVTEMNGAPAMTRAFEARLDAIPHATMREAVQYLKQYDYETFRVFDAIMRRGPLQTYQHVADNLHIATVQTVANRRDIALKTIRDWLLWHLSGIGQEEMDA